MSLDSIELLNQNIKNSNNIAESVDLRPVNSLDTLPREGELLVYGEADLGGVVVPGDDFAYIKITNGNVEGINEDRYFNSPTDQIFVPRYSLLRRRTILKRCRNSRGINITQKVIDSKRVYLIRV
jgi:hypothetical protein